MPFFFFLTHTYTFHLIELGSVSVEVSTFLYDLIFSFFSFFLRGAFFVLVCVHLGALKKKKTRCAAALFFFLFFFFRLSGVRLSDRRWIRFSPQMCAYLSFFLPFPFFFWTSLPLIIWERGSCLSFLALAILQRIKNCHKRIWHVASHPCVRKREKHVVCFDRRNSAAVRTRKHAGVHKRRRGQSEALK